MCLTLEPPTAAAIAARWRSGGRSTFAIVGESYDGPFGIDIKKDGPHALIAGTTGSGKSELLQTIVASLAVANRPDELTFVLIDYKGGSAFAECAQLPHTVGMVTDLDPHQVARALGSLSAELTRREHILAAAGAKDIEAYQLLVDERQAQPLPRLVIVIDEFAAMSRELPDFITGLVNIAQRGRSLGIHLILATQRPSGVVSQDIRANTNLRIALRVTDPAESADVIGVPDAASIGQSTPGRAYVRLGHASIVPFQAGRIGGRRPGAADGVTAKPWLAPLNWTDLGKPDTGPACPGDPPGSQGHRPHGSCRGNPQCRQAAAHPAPAPPVARATPTEPGAARRHADNPRARTGGRRHAVRIRAMGPAGTSTATTGRSESGFFQPPDGSRRAAVRRVPVAAYHRRDARPRAQLRRRAPVRD